MLPTPYYQDDAVTIYHADCKNILPHLAPVDLVVTSPPYNVRIDYGAYKDNLPWDDYLAWCVEWMSSCYVLLKPSGRIAVNCSLTVSYPPTKEVHFAAAELHSAMQSAGFSFAAVPIWTDTHRRSNTFFGSWMSARCPHIYGPYEVVLIGYKGAWGREPGKSTVTPEVFTRLCRGTWSMMAETKPLTPAAYPEALPSYVLQMLSYEGDSILDPFMGSGTTLRVAKDLGRRAIGIEINKEYCEVAAQRMRQAVLPWSTPEAIIEMKQRSIY